METPIRVLYAEDDLRAADLTQAHLARAALDVMIDVVDTGRACREALQTTAYDLLLLNNRLPDLDGIDVLRSLVQDTIAVPVVMITGVGDEQCMVHALRLGAVDYIVKDSDYLDTLPAILKQAVAEFRRKQAQGNALLPTQRVVLYVVEETKDIDLTLQHFAREAPHFSVAVATSAQNALARLLQEQTVDIVLADLDLPGMNVLALLRAFRRQHIELPVVVVTGKEGEDAAIAALKLGAYDYVVERDNYRSQLPYALENAMARYQLDVVNKRILKQWEDLNHSLEAKTEAEREHLLAELEAKNAELERFTYTVSHDLKSPLVTIGGFLGLLEQNVIDGDIDQLKANIPYIRNATDTMSRLLRELLELSRIGRLVNASERVSLTTLAQAATALVAGQLQARNVTLEIAADMPTVYADRLRIVEVLENLLHNAVKFMGARSDPHIWVDARLEGAMVHCSVRDNGIGIAPKYHEKIFRLFEQLSRQEGSTGIGLTLAKRIVEVHGGRIWVESEGPGHGSTFHFTLPG